MRKTHLRTPISLTALFVFGAATLASVPAPQFEPAPQSFDPRSDQGDARPRDLIALQDDLYLLDGSLTALSRRHPRFDDFQRRTAELRIDVSALADRMSRDGRYSDRREEERYGADYRFVPARASEIEALRYRIGLLRSEIENAQRRRWASADLVIPAGTDIEVMLDSGLSSRWANAEDRVEASTVSALTSGGRALIPAGAMVSGSVREVRSRRRGQQDGWLRLDFDSLTPQGGPRMDLRSHVVSVSETRSGGHSVRNGALGGLLGGVIGGLVDGRKGALIGAAVGVGGGLLATRGQEVDLPEGTIIVLRLDRPLAVSRRDLMANRPY